MRMEIGGDDEKCQEYSFVSDTAHETIAENWSAQLGEYNYYNLKMT